MTTINLQEIAGQIEASATKLHQTVRETGQSLSITASLLSKKYPELKPLKDVSIARVREGENGVIYCDIPCVFYSDESNEAEVYGMDISPENITFKSYKTGYGGHCIVEVNGVSLQIRMSCDEDHAIAIEAGDIEPVNGEGKPPAEYLKLIPRPEKPLRDYPVGTVLELISESGISRKHNTQLFTIQTQNGIDKHVLSNATLREGWKKYGNKAKFEVTDIIEIKPKNGKSKESKFEVRLKDLNGVDFSDLSL